MSQVTVISGVERRRPWSDEQKLAFVAAASAPGASVARVARAADLRPSQIYRWRRDLARDAAAGMSAEPGFAPLLIEAGADHDGIGLSLYAKRLDRGRFTWPSATDGAIAISASQMACMLEGIDWRNPRLTWRPSAAG